MGTINNFFSQSELALAAYATLTSSVPDIDELKSTGMSDAQARYFSQQWRVIDQYDGMVEETYVDEFGQEQTFLNPTGLSATVFENVADGKRYLAVRGTKITDLNDIAADGGILLHGLPDQSAQYQALKSKVEQWQQAGVLSGSFNVTGHSLGGWLAGGLTVDFAGSIEHAYLYNAPGVFGAGGQLVDLFNQVFGTEFLSLDLDRISNIRASVGVSPISGLGVNFAPVIGIEIEDHHLGNHFMRHLTDALAVYNLFTTIDPSLNVEIITGIFQAFPVDNDNLLEAALAAVGGIYGKTFPTIETDRDSLYVNLSDLQASLPGQAIITSLTDTSAASLQNQATNPAYLYALLNLNPFAITGADYSHLNQNGALNSDNYSEQFIEDRALFLYALTHKDENHFTEFDTGFVDDALNISADVEGSTVVVSGSAPNIYEWGNGEDSIDGGGGNDHLYGTSANDVIDGSDGDDYIEGGLGQDTLSGGDGNDTFYIQGFDENYDTITGGSGDEDPDKGDIIQGSDGDDGIRIKELTLEHSIEKIDGGGGINFIQGTAGNDTINLTNTEVTNISKILGEGGTDNIIGSDGDDTIFGGESDQITASQFRGGKGNDTILATSGRNNLFGGINDDLLVGGTGRDHLYGGSGTDWLLSRKGGDLLEGGSGYDRYFAMPGDTIEDTDGLGKIYFVSSEKSTSSSKDSITIINPDGSKGHYWGDLLTGGQEDSPNVYLSSDGRYTYRKQSTGLLVTNNNTGGSITIKNWVDGELLIHLQDETENNEPDPATQGWSFAA